MTRKLGTHGTRLTWLPALHGPYESGWSVFEKIRTLNCVGNADLIALLSRDGVTSRGIDIRDGSDSRWIDFKRFSGLLGTPQDILKTGFWDQHGMTRQARIFYAVKHCPQCWSEHRYQCLLFDLACITHCPWHQRELSQPCLSCAQKGQGYCREHPPTNFDDLLSRSPMSAGQRAIITGYCSEFFDWWRSLRVGAPAVGSLISGLVALTGLRNPITNLNWQAGFAQSKVQLSEFNWILRGLTPVPCVYISVLDVGRSVATAKRTDTIRDEIGHCYRSIRRHLYRRYVRRHRRCFTVLSKMDRAEYFTLVGDEVCVTCLAYFAWRMSVEKVVNIEGLFRPRKANFEIKLAQINAARRADYRAGLSLTFLRFFGIWQVIGEKFAKGAVQIAKDEYGAPLHFHYSRDERYTHESTIQEYHCLYPDATNLSLGGACRRRGGHAIHSAAQNRSQISNYSHTIEWTVPPQEILFVLLTRNDPYGIGCRQTIHV